ncbi:DUF3300 domain-containing protein [Paraburkholderia heleia]|uniref:DUF3300 domain-containing protein n=1 Tax=Paraburkholderia heleia TaxID=634127 RepID=UPI002AB6716B|nr:DUF3300 domain-containing protein [Paraburkholderia heleia]
MDIPDRISRTDFMRFPKRIVSFLLTPCITLGTMGHAFADQNNPAPNSLSTAMQRSPEALQQLVAPIALYPDTLVAQILAGATHLAEVVSANRWMQAHPQLKGDALAAQVDRQYWDASVKALTEFPAVLSNMDENVVWTSSLGDAYLSQPQQVMAAIQALRQRALAAGNLQANAQQTVTSEGDLVSIAPAAPDVVYVPEYDPTLVYGAPVAAWPGWYPDTSLYLGGPGIVFGIGLEMGYFGGYGWGWHHWRPDWHRRAVTYNHSPYVWHDRSLADVEHELHSRDSSNRPMDSLGQQGSFGEHGAYAQHGPSGEHGAFSQRESFGMPDTHVSSAPLQVGVQPHANLGAGLGRFGGVGHAGFGHAGFGAARSDFSAMGHFAGGHVSADMHGGHGRG